MSGDGEKNRGGNTHPSYDEKNCQLAHSNNYQNFGHSSNGDMDHQPNDDINRHSHSRPRSYGDFSCQKFDKINCCPYHGDINHQTYYDKKTRHLLHAKNTINLMNVLIQDMVIYTTKTMTIKTIEIKFLPTIEKPIFSIQ